MRDVTETFTTLPPAGQETLPPAGQETPPPAGQGTAAPVPPRPTPEQAGQAARAAGEQLLDLYLPLPVLVDLVVEYAAAQIETGSDARNEYRRNTRRVLIEYGEGMQLDRALERFRLRNAPPILVVAVGVFGLWTTAAAHARLYGAEVRPPSVKLRPDGLIGRAVAKVRGLAGRLFAWL